MEPDNAISRGFKNATGTPGMTQAIQNVQQAASQPPADSAMQRRLKTQQVTPSPS